MKYRQIVKTVAHACINYKLSLPIDFKLILTRTSCMLYAKGENDATFKGRLILLKFRTNTRDFNHEIQFWKLVSL
jgi:hypothetical protein